MILYVSKERCGEGAAIAFPATAEQVQDELRGLGGDGQLLFIRGEGPAWRFEDQLDPAGLLQREGIHKLNRLASLVDAMNLTEQKVFDGALRSEGTTGLDEILDAASNLSRYELIEGIESDFELGRWLVEHDSAWGDIPAEVRRHANHAWIGEKYRETHCGAYTPNGYVRRRETAQTQKRPERPAFRLTLASPTNTYRLELPTNLDGLKQAEQALGLDSLDSASIRDLEIGYPWAHLLPMDSITPGDAIALADWVWAMSDSNLKAFGGVLEVEQPTTFVEAVYIAEEIDNYDVVDCSEGEYGREVLRYAGVGEEILELLDGFTNFDALGRSKMEQAGVRETSFGLVRRLDSPWPQQTEQGQTLHGF